MTFWQSFKLGAYEILQELNKIPDCPMCKGTGNPVMWGEYIYWHGKREYVCSQCKGRGKV